MVIIADSGSTKTDWLLKETGKQRHIFTSGINPFMQDEETISKIIEEQLLKELSPDYVIDEIQFYGAGCTKQKAPILENILRKQTNCDKVEVASDLLCAARYLCGNEEGVACILGTGSNSCYYDGKKIVQNVSPLGYILGDEGSGAVLGKNLVGAILKKQMPEWIEAAFYEETSLSAPDIIEKVYRQPMANRFLARLTYFLANHRSEEAIHKFLVDNFRSFLQRNVALYRRPDLKVSFVGSVAYHFESELREALSIEGYKLGIIKKEPLDD